MRENDENIDEKNELNQQMSKKITLTKRIKIEITLLYAMSVEMIKICIHKKLSIDDYIKKQNN